MHFELFPKRSRLFLLISLIAIGWLSAEILFFYFVNTDTSLSLLFHAAVMLITFGAFVTFYLFEKKLLETLLSAQDSSIIRIESEKEKNLRNYRAILEGSGNPIFIFNAETGKLKELNRKAVELIGLSKEEMMLLQGRELVAAESRDKFHSLVLRVIRRGRARADAITFLRKTGEKVICEADARHLDLGDEKVVFAIVRNITYKQRAEKEIRQKNRELTILNSIIAHANESLQLESTLTVIIQEVLTAFGADAGTIHLVSESGCQKLAAAEGMTSAEYRSINECACPSTMNRLCSALSEGCNSECPINNFALDGGWNSVLGVPLFLRKRLVGTMHLIWKEQKKVSFEDQQFFITLGNQIGIVIEHVKVFRELHLKNEELSKSYLMLEKRTLQLTLSQKRLRENLSRAEQLNQEMTRLDRMKNHFLGMISHEFKTPLTGILGSAELLLAGGAVNSSDKSLLEIVQSGGKRLNEIVNDLLKVAKIENRTLQISSVNIDVSELLNEVTESFTQMIEARNQRIKLDNTMLLPTVFGDRDYLREVFTELLENAVKFTSDGGVIEISASLADKDSLVHRIETLERFSPGFFDKIGSKIFLMVEVRDSGVGIDPAEQTAIFDKFYEGGEIRNHFSSKYKFMGKGTGLGLTIVKGMVEAHAGMIWVESEKPTQSGIRSGSSFFVLLPSDFTEADEPLPEFSIQHDEQII